MREFKLTLSEISKRVEMGDSLRKRKQIISKKKKKGGQDTSEWMKHSKLFKQRPNFKGEAILEGRMQ